MQPVHPNYDLEQSGFVALQSTYDRVVTGHTPMEAANRERHGNWRRLSRPLAAGGLIALGAFGLSVPVVPAILLLAFGLLLLFCFHEASEDWEMPAVRRCCSWLRRIFIRNPPPTSHGDNAP